MYTNQQELPHSELLNTQLNAEENQSNSPSNSTRIIEREPIEGTPFYIGGNEETGYAVSTGNFRLSTIVPTKQEALELLTTDNWNIIANLVATMIAIHEEVTRPKK